MNELSDKTQFGSLPATLNKINNTNASIRIGRRKRKEIPIGFGYPCVSKE